VLRRALLLAVLGMLVLVLPQAAVAQDPVETIPAEPGGGGGNPSPDPAPDPSPPPSSGGGTVSPSPPVYVPPPVAPTQPAEPSGPTPAEIKKRQREKERREAEKRKREAEKRIRAAIKREKGEGYALPDGASLPPPPEVPVVEPEPEPAAAEEPATVDVEPVASALPRSPSATLVETPGGSTLGTATPILVGLLILAVVLLGLAAIPPNSLRGDLGATIVQRRLELGLIGTAVLASAAIGLLLAVLAS
jgi:hypothetical protein